MRGSGRPSVGAASYDPVDGEIIEDESGGSSQSSALATVRGASLMQQPVFAMAQRVDVPRDLHAVSKRVLDEAELMGDDFYYSWTTKTKDGDKIVEGPSIDAAMMLYRNWGNDALPTDIYDEGPTHWIFRAVFVDGETGSSLPRLFRQRKGESHQKTGRDGDGDRKLDIAFQIGQSKAQRNVIVKGLPAWLVNRAMEKAKESAEANYRDKLPESIERAKVAWGKLGIAVGQLEKKLAKPSAAWTTSDCRTLVALHRGIISHETSLENEFPPDAPPVVAPASLQQPNQNFAPAAMPAAAAVAPAPAHGQQTIGGGESKARRTREPGED